jgi:Tol biopolymer transport system component
MVAGTPLYETHPVISADGSTIAYLVDGNQQSAIHVVVRGGQATTACDGCFLPWDVSSNGSKLLFWSLDQRRVGLLDVASRAKTDLLRHTEYAILHASFSPDERWITFLAIGKSKAPIFIAPFSGSAPVDERHWIGVTDGASSESTPRWSPDGNLIYFTSYRDGFECFWAQRLDHRTKKPIGPAFPVHHSHSARRSLGNVTVFWQETGIAKDKLVFPLNDQTANIWMIER